MCIRDSRNIANSVHSRSYFSGIIGFAQNSFIRSNLDVMPTIIRSSTVCLLYTSTIRTKETEEFAGLNGQIQIVYCQKMIIFLGQIP